MPLYTLLLDKEMTASSRKIIVARKWIGHSYEFLLSHLKVKYTIHGLFFCFAFVLRQRCCCSLNRVNVDVHL